MSRHVVPSSRARRPEETRSKAGRAGVVVVVVIITCCCCCFLLAVVVGITRLRNDRRLIVWSSETAARDEGDVGLLSRLAQAGVHHGQPVSQLPPPSTHRPAAAHRRLRLPRDDRRHAPEARPDCSAPQDQRPTVVRRTDGRKTSAAFDLRTAVQLCRVHLALETTVVAGYWRLDPKLLFSPTP